MASADSQGFGHRVACFRQPGHPLSSDEKIDVTQNYSVLRILKHCTGYKDDSVIHSNNIQPCVPTMGQVVS